MKTTIEKTEKQLRGKLHVLKHKLGMNNDEYKAMLWDNFSVDSSVDLNAHQLIDLVHSLEKQANAEFKDLDQWRKRVMASIGGYLKSRGEDGGGNKIKSIACRAAGGYEKFNDIPKQKLVSVYHAFKDKQKIAKNVEAIDTIGVMPEYIRVDLRGVAMA